MEQQAAPAVESKEGMSTLTKVLIVLGILFVLFMGGCVACTYIVASMAGDFAEEIAADIEANPAKAAAEMAVRLNPDLEIVETDDEAGTMTVRNTATEEVTTLDFSDIAEGNFTFGSGDNQVSISAGEGGLTATGSDGSTTRIGAITADDLPDWVLLYPEAELQGGGIFGNGGTDTSSGSFVLSTSDSVEDVLAHYDQAMRDAGYEISQQMTNTGADGRPSGVLVGRHGDTGHTLNIIVGSDGDQTQINTQFGSGSQ